MFGSFFLLLSQLCRVSLSFADTNKVLLPLCFKATVSGNLRRGVSFSVAPTSDFRRAKHSTEILFDIHVKHRLLEKFLKNTDVNVRAA